MIATLRHMALIGGLLVRALPGIAQTVREKTLAKRHRWRYCAHVTEKEVTKFGDSNIQGEQAAMRLFLCSCTPSRAFNGGLGGEAFGLAGGLVCRFANPAQFRHPHSILRGGSQPAKEGNRHA